MITHHFHIECCENNHHNRDDTIYVFPQTWPNTGGGMAEPGYCYGQAFVQQYTTVIFSKKYGKAQVWFDNQLGYTVSPLTDRFWNDLNMQLMKDKGHARHYAISDYAMF
jgi:hypothetical protein